MKVEQWLNVVSSVCCGEDLMNVVEEAFNFLDLLNSVWRCHFTETGQWGDHLYICHQQSSIHPSIWHVSSVGPPMNEQYISYAWSLGASGWSRTSPRRWRQHWRLGEQPSIILFLTEMSFLKVNEETPPDSFHKVKQHLTIGPSSSLS